MKQKIALADIGAIPNPTFINNNHMFRSFYCALVSLAVIGILLIYSIKKLSTLGSVINYESYQKKNNPIVNVEGIQFNLTVQYINFNDPQNLLRQYINGQNMFQYGLNISVQHSNVDNSQQQIVSMYLVDQKSQYYPYNYMSLPANIPKDLQTNSKSIYKKLRIIIEQCNSKLDEKCKQISLQNIFLVVTALGQVNSDFANNINISKYTEEWEDFVALQYPFTFNVKKLTFAAYQFTSHLSVLPKTFNSPNIVKSWCYFDAMDKDFRSLDIFNSIDQYYVFELVADNYSFYESQVMQKIDFILPQIFTVFSLAALALKVITSHYRRWAVQLQAVHQIYGNKRMKRDTILSQNDQSKSIMGINFKNYFKFLTAKQKNNDQKLTETKIKLKKVSKKIDYIQMGNKIYKLEKCLKILCRQNKLSYKSVLEQIQNQPESDLSEQQQINGNKSYSKNLLYSQ